MNSSTPGGDALAGYMLSMNLMFTLQRKNILTRAEAADIVSKAIKNLEAFEHKASFDRQEAFQDAMLTLESLRKVISEG
jgi:polysaccharide pyruvyl transferase WcaK-like protein